MNDASKTNVLFIRRRIGRDTQCDTQSSQRTKVCVRQINNSGEPLGLANGDSDSEFR